MSHTEQHVILVAYFEARILLVRIFLLPASFFLVEQ